MSSLIAERCFNHAQREAVARCPHCRRFFCRECITEHDEKVVCAACLRSLGRRSLLRPATLARLGWVCQCLVSLAALWLFFYFLGELLSRLPSSFHEDTVWRATWWNTQ